MPAARLLAGATALLTATGVLLGGTAAFAAPHHVAAKPAKPAAKATATATAAAAKARSLAKAKAAAKARAAAAAKAKVAAKAAAQPKPAPAKPAPAGKAVVTLPGVTAPAFAADPPLARSACALDVTSLGPQVGHEADDTAAFTRAMTDALAQRPDCFPAGPTGAPQAVVYVPAGTYRLAWLHFPSNVRLEVDAAATLQEPANRLADPATTVSMIQWDAVTRQDPAVTNVSLVGVGSAMTVAKQAALVRGGAAIRPFPVQNFFTMNLDPATTGSTNYNPGLDLADVHGFLVENVFSLQNATNQRAGSTVAWPTSARPVMKLRASSRSPIGGPFVQPTDGVIRNHVNLDGPRGYGPNQLQGASRVTLSNIFTLGGTALRMETDASTDAKGIPDRGATLDQITASNIVGLDCNRAVALTPHGQRNGTVTVHDVWAYSCNQAVAAQTDTNTLPAYRGSFANASVSGVQATGGTLAQLDSTTSLWAVGQSLMPYYVEPGTTWNPRIVCTAQSGPFSKATKDLAQH